MTLRLSTGWIGCIAAMRFPAAARGDAKILISAFHGSLDAKPGSQATIATSLAKSLALALMIALLAIGAPTVADAQPASLQNLGQVNGAPALALGVSANGKVVTGYLFNSPNEAFSWVGGTLTPLGFLSGYTANSTGTAVNSDGSVIAGTSFINSGAASPGEAFRWAGGTITGIGVLPVSNPPCAGNPPPASSLAFGINADGSVIVGQSLDNAVCNGDAFLWSNSAGMQGLGCTNSPYLAGSLCFQNKATGVSADGSVVVGFASQSGTLAGGAWRWVGGNFNVFLGPNAPNCGTACVSANANGVTPDGTIVVGSENTPQAEAFLWNSTTNNLNLLGQLPGGNSSQGLAVNADGSVVVGTAYDNTEHQKAILWTAANGMQVLDTVLAAAGVDLTNWNLGIATGISANGRVIVGYGTGPCNCGAGWIAAMPNARLSDAHDFNGDGKSDIAWRDTSGDNAMWLMNGSSILSSAGLGNISTAWSIVGQRDFNGDGMADLLWRDTSGDLAIWFMNGTTVTSGVGLGTVSPVWSIVGTGDFNGDGMGDILWRDTSGDIAIWLMNGSTVSSSAGLGSLSLSWSIVGTGDFNGDGKRDIVWQDTSGDLAIWFMNGTTVTSGVGLGTIAPPWTIVGTGDFNGDGKSDILWRNTSTGAIAVWLMNGSTILSSAGLGSIATTWSVVETGDFNGDGMSDILWHDTSGDIAIWFMNGTTVSSGVGLGTIATSWSIQGAGAD